MLALEPVAETLADPNSYGFRPERSTADAIEQCFITLAKRASPEWILEGDIRGCFDTVRRHLLLEKVARRIKDDDVMHLLKLMLTASGKQGVPQSGVITPPTMLHTFASIV